LEKDLFRSTVLAAQVSDRGIPTPAPFGSEMTAIQAPSTPETLKEVIQWHKGIAEMFRKMLPNSLNKEWVEQRIARHDFHAWVLALALPE
jgi:hypothetical protein